MLKFYRKVYLENQPDPQAVVYKMTKVSTKGLGDI